MIRQFSIITLLLLCVTCIKAEGNQYIYSLLEPHHPNYISTHVIADIESQLTDSNGGLVIKVKDVEDAGFCISYMDELLPWRTFRNKVVSVYLRNTLTTTPIVLLLDEPDEALFFDMLNKDAGFQQTLFADSCGQVMFDGSTDFQRKLVLFYQDDISNSYPWLFGTSGLIARSSDDFTTNAQYLWVDVAPKAFPTNDKLSLQYPIIGNWVKFGLFPVFVSTYQNDYRYKATFHSLSDVHIAQGEINVTDGLLNSVRWLNDRTWESGLDFVFPIQDHEEIRPYAPGYSFKPAALSVKDHSSVKFQAERVNVNEGIKACYECDDTFEDVMGHYAIKNIYKTSIVDDSQRGKVLMFNEGDFIELPSVQDFDLRNNNFTIAVWVKVNSLDSTAYLPIICNNQPNFYEGLQLGIRKQKAFAGIWHNVLNGSGVVDEGGWVHLACTYDLVTEKIAVYINGEADVTETINYSIIGDDKLFIGHSPNHGYSFSGCLDELIIWDRALSAQDIEELCLKGISHDESLSSSRYYLIGSAMLIIFMGLFWWFYKKRKAPKASEYEVTVPVGQAEPLACKYSIHLIGTFSILNKEDEELSTLFSPRLKSLFILVLLSTIRDGGITSPQVIEELWGEFPKEKAQNTKRVTLNRLRAVLDKIDGISINTQGDKWFIEYNVYEVMIDFGVFWKLWMDSRRGHVPKLLKVLQRGTFLQDFKEPWAIRQKSAFRNHYYDLLISILDGNLMDEDKRKEIADIITLGEPLSEIALQEKVNFYMKKDRRKMARSEYDGFCKVFEGVYAEAYPKSFADMIGEN